MIGVNAPVKEQCLYGEGRTFKVMLIAIIIAGGSIRAEPIECDVGEVKIYTGACGGNPDAGSLFIPHLTAEIKGQVPNLEGQYLQVDAEVYNAGEYKGRISVGRFLFTKLSKSGDTTIFDANCSLGLLGRGTPTVTKTEYSEVIAELRSQSPRFINTRGVTLSGSFDTPPTGTYIDILCQIAEKVGGFVTEDHTGQWVIAGYCSGDGVQVIPDRMQQPPTYGESAYTLGSLSVESASVDMTMGNPLVEPWDYLTVEEAVLTQFIISDDGHLILLNDETLVGDMAMDVVQSGHLEFTHSDDLNVDFAISNGRLYLYEQGANHNVPCLRITQTFNGGCSTEIDAEVDTEVQDAVTAQGPLSKAIQHFWADQDGAHITEVSKDDFLDNPSGGNVLITSEEMQIRQALLALATFMKNGVKLSSEETEDLAHFYVQTEDGKDYSSLSLGAYDNPTILGYQDEDGNGELIMQASGQIIDEDDPTGNGVWLAEVIENEGKISLRRLLSIGSGHAYETSLSLWDGHIEFSSPEQREALLIGGDGGITSKGDIRGLSFRVSGHSSPIGTVVTAYLASAKSASPSTATKVCSISLPRGTWTVVGYVRFPSNNSGLRRASFETSVSNSIHIQQNAAQGGVTQLQVNAIVEVTSSSQTWYLNAWHNSTDTLSLPAGTATGYINGIRAVRIA